MKIDELTKVLADAAYSDEETIRIALRDMARFSTALLDYINPIEDDEDLKNRRDRVKDTGIAAYRNILIMMERINIRGYVEGRAEQRMKKIVQKLGLATIEEE